MLSIWARLADLPDPRSGNARRHKLLDVLTIALTASICGAESCVDFADFARDRETLFRDFLELRGGVPSHDTFSRLFRLLDPAAFASCFAGFVDDLGQGGTGVVAIDGKTMRRSFDRAAGKSALHVVTAFAADARMTIGQVAAGDKESEITAARVAWSDRPDRCAGDRRCVALPGRNRASDQGSRGRLAVYAESEPPATTCRGPCLVRRSGQQTRRRTYHDRRR